MKKTFLIAGLIACIGATNSYADIVISQPDDNSDMVVTVARAAKDTQNTKKQINPRPADSVSSIKSKMADGGTGAVAINCPGHCTPDCAILGNVVLCECKTSNGEACTTEVVLSDADIPVRAPSK